MLIEYETSGRIRSILTGCDDFCDLYDGWLQTATQNIAPSTHYILDGEPTERPASPVTRTDLTLHDVPNGATLFINGESYPAEGEVELEFPMAGIYQLRVECFPFLDWNDEVTV